MFLVRITSEKNTGTNDSAIYQTEGERGEMMEDTGEGDMVSVSLYIPSQKGKHGGFSEH